MRGKLRIFFGNKTAIIYGMDLHRLFMRHRGALRIGLKLLVAIVGIELGIMFAFDSFGIKSDSSWAGVFDALLLGLLSSGLIFVWVVRPLKQAKQQNDLFQTIVNTLPAGVVVTDYSNDEHRIISVNPAFSNITGYAAEEVLGRNPRLLQGDDVDKEALEKTRKAMRENRPVHVVQRNRRKDGSRFWNDLYLSPIVDASGRAVQWVGLVHDITEQHRLRARAARLSHAIEHACECMCVISEDGRIEAANPAFVATVGAVREQDLIGDDYWRYWDADDEETRRAMVAVEQGRSWEGKHRRRRRDGTSYPALSSLTPIGVEGGVLKFTAISRDISAVVEVENKLQQAQKMEAVGTLAGGIAHDFNNILAAMLGNLYLVQQSMAEHPKALERLKRIERQGYRAADVIRQLLTFARSAKMEKKEFDLPPFLRETIKFMRPGIPEKIELVADIAREKMPVCGDPARLQQAVLNLVTNARHAIEEKGIADGRIVLRAMPGDKLSESARSAPGNGPRKISAADCVCLEIEDNGIGMDDDRLQRIFEPYFTTKEVGRGTGLGLPMVKGTIESQGGCLDVESKKGEGSCFRIWLPISAGKGMAGNEVSDETGLARGDGEVILIADDNTEAREALKEMLECVGYEVVTASDGEEARQLFYVNKGRLHGAFLDIVMPRCSGAVVAREILEQCPGMPVCLMTGYDIRDTLSSEGFLETGMVDVLRKPWNLSHVNDALARMNRQRMHVVNEG